MPTLEAETEQLNQQIAATTSPSGGYLTPDPRSVADIKTHLGTIQQVMREVMKQGIHYGTIPGCGDKPTLFKAGAEVLKTAFKLSDELVCERLIDCGDEITYRVTARLSHAPTGVFLGSGVGECSTLETKYAWRESVSDEEFQATPETRRRLKYWRNRATKETGKTQQVRTVPADLANTVLKMAAKRAVVAGCLSTLGASDLFTQDIEDMDKAAFQADRGARATGGSQPTTLPPSTLPPFGHQGGERIDSVDLSALEFYRDTVASSIRDPKKATFKSKNTAMLAAIEQRISILEHAEESPIEDATPEPGFILSVEKLNKGNAVRDLMAKMKISTLQEIPESEQAVFLEAVRS